MLSPLPRRSGWAYRFAHSPSRISLPRKGRRVGLRIVLFEACSTFTRVTACTLALSPIRDTHSEGFSYFVTSIAAPAASGWSVCRVGLAPTGKRRLVTAHTLSGLGQRRRLNTLPRRDQQSFMFLSGHRAYTANGGEPYCEKPSNEDGCFADDTEDRHDHSPSLHAACDSHERVNGRGYEHKTGPGVTYDHRDIGSDRPCNCRQIANHPARLKHYDAHDHIYHAWLEQHEAWVVCEDRRRARPRLKDRSSPADGHWREQRL